MTSPDSPNENDTLTSREAFLVMSNYIWRNAQRAGDDLITLLGDTTPPRVVGRLCGSSRVRSIESS